MNRNEWLILTADVVERLCTLKTSDCMVRPNNIDNCNVSSENVATNVVGDVDVCDSELQASGVRTLACNVETMVNDNTQPEFLDVDQVTVETTDTGRASADVLRQEQREDTTLTGCWKLAKLNKSGFHITDGLLWHVECMFGQKIELCVPLNRRLKC